MPPAKLSSAIPGSHFDPVIVDAFLARFDDFRNAEAQADGGRTIERPSQESELSPVPACATVE